MRLLLLFIWLGFSAAVQAHDGLDLPPPASPAEAWNVLQLCRANLEKLVGGEQWSEIPIQASLSMQAARYLRDQMPPEAADRRMKVQDLENAGLFLVRSSMKGQADRVRQDAARYYGALAAVASGFPKEIVEAPVFSCPMCRGVRDLEPAKTCFKCGMKLVPRVIPASSLYNTPGEPSIALTPLLGRPLTAGQTSEVLLRLTRKKDHAPVTPEELLEMHTERIHLLIIDESLTDYHHEHPRPTETPGVYQFTLTPRRAGSYRVFADVVPRLSNTQEYPVCDLSAASPGESITDRREVSSVIVDGLRFELTWSGLPVKAKQPVNAAIRVTTADGQPFTQLEPVMGTFAHIVGFHEDRETVLHIHPSGAEPQKPEDRGGPSFNFRFFAPKAGFFRLYGQVQIGGKAVFAPFGLTVEP